MPLTTDIQQLIDQLPELDKSGKVDGPTREEGFKLFDDLLLIGPDAIEGVVAMIGPVDDGGDYKARYAIRGMVMRSGEPGKAKQRDMLAKAMCKQLENDLPATTKNFLIYELVFAGGDESIATLGGMLRDAETFDAAMAALLTIGGEAAAAQFRKAWGEVKGEQRIGIALGLGQLKDRQAVELLRRAVGDAPSRIAAMWALANIGDAGSADLILKAADATKDFQRIKALSACLLLAENCLSAGDQKTARRVYQYLRDHCKAADEQHVRDAAKAGLNT